MRPVSVVSGPASVLMRADIDTDQIIGREFTITTSREGLGRGLFHAWRQEDPAFPLNHRKPTVLIAGPNFACGSSREHAVWSIMDFGIKAIIAHGFGGHFYENAFKNGLLPVSLPAEQVQQLADLVAAEDAPVTVSLPELTVTAGPLRFPFELAEDRRQALLEGLDEIGLTLRHDPEVARFQAEDRGRRPWIYIPLHASAGGRPA